MSPPIPSLVLSIGLLEKYYSRTQKTLVMGMGGIVSDKLVVILCFSGCVISLLPALCGCFENVLFISSFSSFTMMCLLCFLFVLPGI